MILSDQLTDIGRFGHPHGINGELQATIDDDIDLNALSCIIVDIDGINVPFFIKSYRQRGAQSYLIMLDDINDEQVAARFTNKEIYALCEQCQRDENQSDGFYAEDLVGFTVSDISESFKGEIIGIDDSTSNVLFIIKTDDGTQKLLPVADEFIADIDIEHKHIIFDLPEGILEI